MADRVTAKARYEALKVKREPFLNRGRDAAALTLPSMLPPVGHNATTRLIEPYQSLGSHGVVNLASRLLTALYPPGTSSFRLTLPAEAIMAAGANGVPSDIDTGLVLAEKLINGEIERRQWRHATSLGLQHLIVTGNVLEQTLSDNRIRMFRLDQYCVVRDVTGSLKEVVIEEYVWPESLSEDVKKMVQYTEGNERIPLYTWGKRQKNGSWEIHQEVEESAIGDSYGEYTTNPFRALRWSSVLGEDYGRGKVEEHIADLRSFDELSKSMNDGAAMASRHVWMVRPNAAGGLNLRRRLAKASNGDVIIGNPEDAEMLQFTNNNGLQVVDTQIERLARSIMTGFLLNSSARRDAERVTATELRMMTEELEGALGGVYSMLAEDMQRPRITRLILQMQDNNQLPPWDDTLVEPTILTGLEALGREQDINRVNLALQMLAQTQDPMVMQYVKMDVLLNKVFNGLQLADAVRTEEEVQQRVQQQMAQQVGTNVTEAGGIAAAQAAAQGGAP